MVLPIIASLVIGFAGGLNDALLSADSSSTEPGAGTYGLYAV